MPTKERRLKEQSKKECDRKQKFDIVLHVLKDRSFVTERGPGRKLRGPLNFFWKCKEGVLKFVGDSEGGLEKISQFNFE